MELNRRDMLKASIGALALPTVAKAAQGDYAKIGTLNYSNNPLDPYERAPANCCCSIMQMQHYLRTGEDIPLSAWYLQLRAGTESFTDGIYVYHGFSSPWLAVRLDATYGSCPASMFRPGRLTWTPQIVAEAELRKGRFDFLTLTGQPTPPAVPDYPAALVHLAANPGDAVLLGQYGYDGAAIVGVDADGKGIFVRHYQQRGKAEVTHKTLQEGTAFWDKMIYQNPPQYQPVEFMTVHRMRW